MPDRSSAALAEAPNTPHGSGVDGPALYRRITWRLIPYMFLLYILAYLDRVNVGFAAVQMKQELHFSDTVYGTGAGIFFLGSALFDVPSNLILSRVGPRVWIARIMITWGIISSCMVFVHSPWSFYGLRFLLGVSEAGFFPGMILYLTYWFPSQERARSVARFMTATAIAGVIGAPLSSALLKLDGAGGLHGWQWLFLSEGLPTIVAGISVLMLLKDRPDQANWLKPEEREWLDGELKRDREAAGGGERHKFLDAIKLPALWILAAIFFASQVSIYTVNLWMPLILNSFHTGGGARNALSPAEASMIARYATLPYLATAIAMAIIGWSSDRLNDRRWHVAGCLLLSAGGFAWVAHAQSTTVVLVAFSLAAIGVFSLQGPFWTWLTTMVEGTAAAGGIAIITTVGGFGGFLGPYVTGRLRDATHSFAGGLYGMAVLAVAAAGLSLTLRNVRAGQHEADRQQADK
jgi:ACS family tartrate transporter-like MFS transporter